VGVTQCKEHSKYWCNKQTQVNPLLDKYRPIGFFSWNSLSCNIITVSPNWTSSHSLNLKISKGILRGHPRSVYWPQTKKVTWDVLCSTFNQIKVKAWRTWAWDRLYQKHTQDHCRSISLLEYDPSVNQTAESYFRTKVNNKSKAGRDNMKWQSQIQWCKLKVVTSKQEDFNLVFTNHRKEDRIYPPRKENIL